MDAEHERSQKNVPKHKDKLLTTIQDRYKSILEKIFFDVLEFFRNFFHGFRPPPSSQMPAPRLRPGGQVGGSRAARARKESEKHPKT